MNSHKNARLTLKGRGLLVHRILVESWTVAAASEASGVSRRTGSKWLRRYRQEGPEGLADRSSRPHQSPNRTEESLLHEWVCWRRERMTQRQIAARSGRSIATVSRHMSQAGLSRLASLDPPVPVIRYERPNPGSLVHIDTKRLGKIDGVGHRIHGDRRTRKRGAGWEAVHLAIDDHSRVAFGMVLPDETAASCVRFLVAANEHFQALGVHVQEVMTDNGTGYKNVYRAACAELGVKHLKTRPYTPRTNGKVERFVQTSLREWAYARAYASSELRTEALNGFLRYYNYERPHSALGRLAPISRIKSGNNLLKLNT